MKKALLLALAVIIIFSTFTGCDAVKEVIENKKGASLGEKADDTKIPLDGAQIEYVSSTSTSLTVKIRNNTSSTWQSGNRRDYTLEAEKDGEWYAVTQIGELANTMELMIIAPGNEFTHTFEFSGRYGKLQPGKYRVVKALWANATENSAAGEFHLVCEFTVA